MFSSITSLLSSDNNTVIINQDDPKSYRFFNSPSVSFISERGFLPGKNPLEQLPANSDFANKLNEIAKNIPQLLKTHQLKAALDKLNAEFPDEMLVLTKGNKQQEYIAILTLIMIAQAYLWEENDKPKNVIPSIIAKNLYKLCRSQQRFPTITYSDYVLHNWRLLDSKKPISLDNIEPIFTFTGSKDEAWFIKIHVVVEAECSNALQAACKAYSLIHMLKKNPDDFNKKNEKQLTNLLNMMTNSIEEATSIIKKMKDGCDPQFFFFKLRHYLNGWEKIKIESLEGSVETGVKFAGIQTRDKNAAHSYRGTSGAQSSVLPALDAFFEIEHDINSMFKTLLEFQEYMPKKHRAFINFIGNNKLNNVIELTDSQEIKNARNNAIHQLELFRASHMGLVHQYIYNPASTIGINKNDITGTGSAPINKYLGDRYTNTRNSRFT